MTRTVLITSGKGGVGKSTISMNVAYALAKLSYKVCLIDADFGLKNLDVMMGLENRVIYDLKDVLENKCSLNQILVKDKRMDSLWLLPACKSLSFENINLEHIQNMIELLKPSFDFILIDSPAGIEKGFQCASLLCDEAIVVVTLDAVSLRDADRVIGLLVKQGINQLHMLVNKYNENDIQKGKSLNLKEAHDILAIPLLGIVYDDHDIIEANNKGIPLYLKPQNSTAKCFERIVLRLEGKEIPFVKKNKKHLFDKIFG